MKLSHGSSRAISSLNFDDGSVEIVVELPESPHRMREHRTSTFQLSRDQAVELAKALRAWIEKVEWTERVETAERIEKMERMDSASYT